MPVIGSSLVLSWARVHEGVMRRSLEVVVGADDEVEEVMRMGMSRVVMGTEFIIVEGGLPAPLLNDLFYV